MCTALKVLTTVEAALNGSCTRLCGLAHQGLPWVMNATLKVDSELVATWVLQAVGKRHGARDAAQGVSMAATTAGTLQGEIRR
jgi:hypothetical protein